jgi:hypothetical protein
MAALSLWHGERAGGLLTIIAWRCIFISQAGGGQGQAALLPHTATGALIGGSGA